MYAGGIRDDVIALDFDGAAEIRLLLHDSELRRKEQENLLVGLFSRALSLPSTDQPTAAQPPQDVFQAGDPRLANPFDPSLPKNRTVLFGVPKGS